MLTNNYYTIWFTTLNNSSGGTSSTQANKVTVKTASGVERYTSGAVDNNSISVITLNEASYFRQNTYVNNTGTYFGDGTGELTRDSYKLFGNVITGLAVTSNIKTTRENDIVTKEVTFTVANNNAQDITISEIGIFGGSGKYYPNIDSSSTSSYSDYLLLEHTLLDEPVTIPAGGVGQVTYTITFNIA